MRLRVFLVCVALIVGMILPDKNFIIQKNVGQGDALLYRDKKQATMIDTGEYRNEKDSQWMRFFFQNQVINIDQILFTHLDSDHASAARRIERLIPVKECWVAREHLRERKSPCVFTPTVEPVESQNLKISTISTDSKKGNSTMTGVWIRTEDLDYLNLGDADMRLEWRLFQNLKKKWKGESYSRYRIFKITHHGSRYSLSEKLLNSYDPDEAWMSVGARNRHGHPASRTMQLLGYARVNVRRTDVEGDLFSPL